MQKVTILILATIIICLPLYQIKADGGFIPYNYEDIYEPSQTALIVYDDGQEDLYLKVNYEGETNKFVWIVPTPSYPEASEAPKNLFEELSTLTEVSERSWQEAPGLDIGAQKTDSINVIVHSQEQIGIYQVTVLSATGVDGLFTWLNDHKYNVREDVKEILDWYIQKEWYFTAIRIEPEINLDLAISNFQIIDNTVNQDNFSEKYAEYFYESLRSKDHKTFIKLIDIIVEILPVYGDTYQQINQNEFKQIADVLINEYENEEQWQELKDEAADSLETELKGFYPEEVSKYSDYIEPIKISFKVNTIVYPFKISQFSTKVPDSETDSPKTNQVLLYVLADKQMIAPGFTVEYNELVNPEIIETRELELYQNLDNLKEIITKEYFLTKLRRDFAKVEIDNDLYFITDDGSDQGTSELTEYNLALARDEQRISDIKQIQIALELYFNDNNKYCDELTDQSLNQESNYLAVIPTNPSPGGIDYLYDVISEGEEYLLHFELEKGDSRYGGGLCVASASGIDCEAEFEQEPIITLSQSYQVNQEYQLAMKMVQGSALSDRLKGMIVLKVEENGEAYYINPKTMLKRYLGRPDDAFQVMREMGIGITNTDLTKIPIGLANLTGPDSDLDGLSDLFEDAIGTNKNSQDSDNDGYGDKQELDNNYNPNGEGRLNYNNIFTNQQKGKIFLQVEVHGEAWYINPSDGKRYFLGRPADAFQVMRNLGLGISNKDFDELL